jgi:hypothetical protein
MRPKFFDLFLVLLLLASFSIAYADSENNGRKMLNEAQLLLEQERFLEAGQLYKKVVSECPGTSEADEAKFYIEEFNRIALGKLRTAYMCSRAFFMDKPDGSIDFETLRRYGLRQSKGTTIKILKNTKQDLQITGEHLAGDKVHTIYADGRETTSGGSSEVDIAEPKGLNWENYIVKESVLLGGKRLAHSIDKGRLSYPSKNTVRVWHRVAPAEDSGAKVTWESVELRDVNCAKKEYKRLKGRFTNKTRNETLGEDIWLPLFGAIHDAFHKAVCEKP